MIYGADNNKGIVLDGLKLKSVTIGEDGYTMDDVLVHDAHEQSNTLQMMLSMMGYQNDLPVALGVIRDVEAPCYDVAVHQQIADVQAKNPTRTLHDLLMQGDVWEIK
jgi:2-oxoglutarate ferredoxin oxidoreductase subunit beta